VKSFFAAQPFILVESLTKNLEQKAGLQMPTVTSVRFQIKIHCQLTIGTITIHFLLGKFSEMPQTSLRLCSD
ncbi:hypothetical protein, partial [Hufsiella arboris]|uniref:hypothetical protein n=1 Tax=Hufsiella arboris TaxID=2695275 RepID=UPI001F1D6089